MDKVTDIIEWNVIGERSDLPEPLQDKLWSFKHIPGSWIGNLEATRSFVQDVQFHGNVRVEEAVAWAEVPVFKGAAEKDKFIN